jgi:hypothetical protein
MLKQAQADCFFRAGIDRASPFTHIQLPIHAKVLPPSILLLIDTGREQHEVIESL